MSKVKSLLGVLGFIGDKPWNKDPYYTTRIQWKVRPGFLRGSNEYTRHQWFNLIFVGGINPQKWRISVWILEVYPQTKGGKMEHEEFQSGDSDVWSYAGWQASGRSVQRRFLGKHNFGGSYLKGYRVLLLFLLANLISNLISRPSIPGGSQPHRNSAGGAHQLISGWDCNHICCAEERWDQRGDRSTTCHVYLEVQDA